MGTVPPIGDRIGTNMSPTDPAGAPRRDGTRPQWSEVLWALREARGVTQEGWGARLGVSRKTVQRWERGERAPDPGAEAAILSYCREMGLLRPYSRGPLAGVTLTAELLQELLSEARWGVRQHHRATNHRSHGRTACHMRYPPPRPRTCPCS